jgi:hypothetical protein
VRKTLLLLAAAAFPSLAQAGDLGINLYGLSYHFDRDRARELHDDNGFNYGLGARYRLPGESVDWLPGESIDWFFDAGAYHDSGRNTAVLAAAGGYWHATERVRLGAALAFLHSRTYNDGQAFVAALPVAAYEWRSVTLNMVYLPKVRELNNINTLGFWLTVWLR